MSFYTRPMLSYLAIVVLAAVALFAPVVATANTQQQQCEGKGGVSPDQRIAACTAIIKNSSISPKQRGQTYRTRGTVYFYKNDYARAVADYTQAIKLNPQDSEAFDNRCWTRATIDKLPDALKDCIESLRIRPNYAPTTDTLGFVYLKLGQFDLAITTYSAALKLNPKSAYSLYGRGIAKLKTGDTASGQADIAASKAIKDVAEEMARYGVK